MNMDILLELWVSSLVEAAKVKWMLGSGERWQPGQNLKLLLTCYRDYVFRIDRNPLFVFLS